MEIPSLLIDQIRDGKAVLFLGSGATLSASDKKGNSPPNAQQLGNLLADKFLNGKFKDLPLNQIGEYAISESDLTTVQEYIRSIFEPYEPSDSYCIIPTFRWWAIATTNYDRLVERAYEKIESSQILKPFIENGDRVEEHLRDSKNVMLLKLHGCITRTASKSCPLILTTDQYIEYRNGRSRLFDHLKGMAYEKTILFVGHSLQDADLRAILLELTGSGERRPMFYLVAPNIDSVQARFWTGKKNTPISCTFEDFILELRTKIPIESPSTVDVASTLSLSPIAQYLKSKDATLSKNCMQFVSVDVECVKGSISTKVVEPKEFYKGVNPDWSAVEQSLDAPRHLTDTILSEHFLVEEERHFGRMELVLIKAHAGAGKSVMMRRMAWDAANSYDCLCLYLQSYGVISTAALQELLTLTDKRIYLFIDNAADHVREIQHLARNIGPDGKRLTIITAERINEWNMFCDSLSAIVTADYELKYLSSKEIDLLLALLDRHKALGTLSEASLESRRLAFAEHAGRQLLVALHEATLGKSFEDIIEDEYAHIQPTEAQVIYLTVCVLNRLGVPVRAGIISRIHGVPFDEFKTRLFAPLEHVVQNEYDPIIRDYVYYARHPHIAEIVFEKILRKQEDKFDHYIKALKALNVDYKADRNAFREMTRGRVLLELFSNHELVQHIYKVAQDQVGEDPHLLHQMAIYEMNRADGNMTECGNLLAEASRLAPEDANIKHSRAEYCLRLSEHARTSLERDKFLSEASQIAQALARNRFVGAYGHHTLIKIGLVRLVDVLKSENPDSSTLEKYIKEVEQCLSDAFQLFPGNAYLYEAEARYASLVADSKRAMEALQKAFDTNPRSVFIALRLANCYKNSGEGDRAKEVLEKALAANQNEKKLHYNYAKLLMDLEMGNKDLMTYHLKRSFAEGDKNYDAQLLFGRQLFLNGDFLESKEFYRKLRVSASVGIDSRRNILYPLKERFAGKVARVEASHCFIARDGINDWIYAHRNNIKESVWKIIDQGSRVSFLVGFSLGGVNAFDVDSAEGKK